jgi:hypothetical protein
VKTREAVLFAAAFGVYMLALCPMVYVGDSGLFSAAAFSLGSAHPPGYPLYVLVGKLFTLLPFGNIAFKVNAASALFGALACLTVYRTSVELTGDEHASWAAALVMGITPLFFTESLKAEVYTLNAFLSAVVFYLGLRILTGGDFRRYSLAALFVLGLGMGNHHTIALTGLTLLLPLGMRWREMGIRWTALGTALFLAGLSVNLFVYLRTLAVLDHGGLILYAKAPTLGELLRVFLRSGYEVSTGQAVATLTHAAGGWLTGLRNVLALVIYPNTRPLLPFLFIGLASLARRPAVLAYVLLAGAAWLAVLGAVVLPAPEPTVKDMQVASVYFVPVLGVLYAAVAAGLAWCIAFVKRRRWKDAARFVPAAVTALPLVFLPYSLRDHALNRTFLAYDYGRDMISALPPKSLLMNHSDNALFTTFYFRTVERLREDVLTMNTGGRRNVFGLEDSPPWKYADLFPGFYGSEKSTLSELDRDFALAGRLFVNDPHVLSRVFADSHVTYPSVFAAALWPRELPDEDFRQAIRGRFRESFPLVNWERTLEGHHPPDLLLTELRTAYGFNLAVWGDLMDRAGHPREARSLLSAAFRTAEADRFLWPYLDYLVGEGRGKRALALVAELRASEGFGDLPDVWEERTRSAMREGEGVQ